jgi:pfkB family carbohydrate kinase
VGVAPSSGAVGDDAFGEVVLRRLVDHGVTPKLIRVIPGVPTGSAFVSYNDDGIRDFVYNIVHSAAARFAADEATMAALDAFGVDVMHVSGSALGDPVMGAEAVRVCKALHSKGVTISFDPICARSSSTIPLISLWRARCQSAPNIDPRSASKFWTPITPKTGSLFHAETHSAMSSQLPCLGV